MKQDVKSDARGKWKGTLMTLGVPEKFLSGRHCPCPMCGGTDRFRWDDKGGTGSYYCNQCGAGSGIDLLMNYRGWDFRTAADEVRKVLGTMRPDPAKPEMTPEQKRQRMREFSKTFRRIQKGDDVDRYLANRGVAEDHYPEDLFIAPEARYSRDLSFPAMVGLVRDVDGKPVNVHRTFLQDGKKAPVSPNRKIMQGPLPDGSCVRLGGVVGGQVQASIGIAEGIETALASMQQYDLPVWAAISANGLQNWKAPMGVEEVTIFGDRDESFTGQAAAYQLAKRLKHEGLTVYVKLPEVIGDFADIPFPAKGSA